MNKKLNKDVMLEEMLLSSNKHKKNFVRFKDFIDLKSKKIKKLYKKKSSLIQSLDSDNSKLPNIKGQNNDTTSFFMNTFTHDERSYNQYNFPIQEKNSEIFENDDDVSYNNNKYNTFHVDEDVVRLDDNSDGILNTDDNEENKLFYLKELDKFKKNFSQSHLKTIKDAVTTFYQKNKKAAFTLDKEFFNNKKTNQGNARIHFTNNFFASVMFPRNSFYNQYEKEQKNSKSKEKEDKKNVYYKIASRKQSILSVLDKHDDENTKTRKDKSRYSIKSNNTLISKKSGYNFCLINKEKENFLCKNFLILVNNKKEPSHTSLNYLKKESRDISSTIGNTISNKETEGVLDDFKDKNIDSNNKNLLSLKTLTKTSKKEKLLVNTKRHSFFANSFKFPNIALRKHNITDKDKYVENNGLSVSVRRESTISHNVNSLRCKINNDKKEIQDPLNSKQENKDEDHNNENMITKGLLIRTMINEKMQSKKNQNENHHEDTIAKENREKGILSPNKKESTKSKVNFASSSLKKIENNTNKDNDINKSTICDTEHKKHDSTITFDLPYNPQTQENTVSTKQLPITKEYHKNKSYKSNKSSVTKFSLSKNSQNKTYQTKHSKHSSYYVKKAEDFIQNKKKIENNKNQKLLKNMKYKAAKLKKLQLNSLSKLNNYLFCNHAVRNNKKDVYDMYENFSNKNNRIKEESNKVMDIANDTYHNLIENKIKKLSKSMIRTKERVSNKHSSKLLLSLEDKEYELEKDELKENFTFFGHITGQSLSKQQENDWRMQMKIEQDKKIEENSKKLAGLMDTLQAEEYNIEGWLKDKEYSLKHYHEGNLKRVSIVRKLLKNKDIPETEVSGITPQMIRSDKLEHDKYLIHVFKNKFYPKAVRDNFKSTTIEKYRGLSGAMFGV